MYAFTWEILAGGMGAVLLVGLVTLLSKVFYVMEIPFATLVAFAAVYMLGSFVARVFYSRVYHFALKDTVLSRTLRRMLELLAHVDFVPGRPGAVLHEQNQ